MQKYQDDNLKALVCKCLMNFNASINGSSNMSVQLYLMSSRVCFHSVVDVFKDEGITQPVRVSSL